MLGLDAVGVGGNGLQEDDKLRRCTATASSVHSGGAGVREEGWV
jgi:hypothetical protein